MYNQIERDIKSANFIARYEEFRGHKNDIKQCKYFIFNKEWVDKYYENIKAKEILSLKD